MRRCPNHRRSVLLVAGKSGTLLGGVLVFLMSTYRREFMASVFSKIISGEFSVFKIYEDENTLVFLSKFAVQPGHTLIVPKIEVDSFMDVPEPYYSAVFRNAQVVGRAIQRATGCRRVGCMIAGWDVPHFHYHLVPMNDHHDMDPLNARELGFDENKLLQKRIMEELTKVLAE